jgi:hypothetical protein
VTFSVQILPLLLSPGTQNATIFCGYRNVHTKKKYVCKKSVFHEDTASETVEGVNRFCKMSATKQNVKLSLFFVKNDSPTQILRMKYTVS